MRISPALGQFPGERNHETDVDPKRQTFERRKSALRHSAPKSGIARAKDRGGRIGILRPAELALTLRQAPERVRLFLALGAFTGMRSSEVLRLDWKDVNFERSFITVSPEKAKTATRRLVPIQPNLMRWLAPYRNHARAVFKTPRDAGRAIAFAKNCHVEWPNNALRHSYATYRLAITADCRTGCPGNGKQPAEADDQLPGARRRKRGTGMV